jgi:hypothetical protein
MSPRFEALPGSPWADILSPRPVSNPQAQNRSHRVATAASRGRHRPDGPDRRAWVPLSIADVKLAVQRALGKPAGRETVGKTAAVVLKSLLLPM